ncbi:hypothetical protein V8E53_010319 [Lactarius tabidus]
MGIADPPCSGYIRDVASHPRNGSTPTRGGAIAGTAQIDHHAPNDACRRAATTSTVPRARSGWSGFSEFTIRLPGPFGKRVAHRDSVHPTHWIPHLVHAPIAVMNPLPVLYHERTKTRLVPCASTLTRCIWTRKLAPPLHSTALMMTYDSRAPKLKTSLNLAPPSLERAQIGTLRPTWRKLLKDTKRGDQPGLPSPPSTLLRLLRYSIPSDLPSFPGMRKYVATFKLCASASGLYQLISAAMWLDKINDLPKQQEVNVIEPEGNRNLGHEWPPWPFKLISPLPAIMITTGIKGASLDMLGVPRVRYSEILLMLSVKLELVQWPQTHAPRVRAAVIIVIRSDRDIDKPQQADYLRSCDHGARFAVRERSLYATPHIIPQALQDSGTTLLIQALFASLFTNDKAR